MLNTIYQQFDFEQISKELKNKKIKIKRVAGKGKDGSQMTDSMISNATEVSESTTNFNSINPTSRPNLFPQNFLQNTGAFTKSSVPPPNISSMSFQNNRSIVNEPHMPPNIQDHFQQSSTNPLQDATIVQSQIMKTNKPPPPPGSSSSQIAPVQSITKHKLDQFLNRPMNRKQNPLFHSTSVEPASRAKNFKDQMVSNRAEADRQGSMNQSAIQNLLGGPSGQVRPGGRGTGNERVFEQSQNPLFMSYDTSLKSNNNAGQKGNMFDVQRFILPQSVSATISEEDSKVFGIKLHISNEKSQIDQDFDQLIVQVTQLINQTRSGLHKKCDQFLQKYMANFENLKDRVKDFKNQSKDLPFKGANISAPQKVTLQSLSYIHREPIQQTISNPNQSVIMTGGVNMGNPQNVIKLKEEKCNFQATVDNIEKEIEKKFLTFLAEEINKQSFHLPQYKYSQSTHSLLTEIKVAINASLSDSLTNFPHLIHSADFPNFSNLSVLPKVSTLTFENDRHAALGDFQANQSLNFVPTEKYITSHQNSIMCISVYFDDVLNVHKAVTGSKDSTLRIINLDSQNEEATLSGGHMGAINSLVIFKSFAHEMESKKSNTLAMLKGQETSTKCTRFAASGGGIGDGRIAIWNLQKKTLVQTLIQHTEAVTCLQSLSDGQTLISGSHDMLIVIWDVLKGTMVQKILDHVGQINCLSLSKDEGRLVTGSSDKQIKLWKLTYEYEPTLQRNTFGKIELDKTINDSVYVYSAQVSSLDRNLLFTGGSDAQIKIWNLQTAQVERQIVGHQSLVSEMLLFENPFESEKQRHFFILSAGCSEEHLRLSNPISPINNSINIEDQINTDWTASTSPIMNFFTDKTDESLRIVVASQSSEEKSFLILKSRF